jgi:hypothetical protein
MATGTSLSSTSNLSDGQKIVIAGARMAFEPAAPDPDLVNNSRIGQGEKQWTVQTYARLSNAGALTEGVDLSQVQQLVTASTTITPSEHGIIVNLSKRLMRRQGDANVRTLAGTLIGASLRRVMAADVVTLYDGLSKSIVGASNALDITSFRGGVAYLMTDQGASHGPAQPPFHASLHIEQISDIILDITDTTPRGTTTGISGDLLQRWWKASDRLYGVQVYHSQIIERDASGDAKGAIFNPAFAELVMANEAEVTDEPDNSLRAVEFGIFQEWGEAEIADPYGIEVYSDATATV